MPPNIYTAAVENSSGAQAVVCVHIYPGTEICIIRRAHMRIVYYIIKRREPLSRAQRDKTNNNKLARTNNGCVYK